MVNDDYKHLHAGDAAQAMLRDISDSITDEQLAKLRSDYLDASLDYDHIRFATQIEGLQMVVIRNGGILAHSKLPTFYKKKHPINDKK